MHGQWSGFDLANSSDSTEKQAENLKYYIKETINTSPTMFIGYSGGADAFFKLVEENFTGHHRLYWVDYGKEPNANVQQFLDINPNHRNFIGEQDADKFLLELAIELKCFPTELFKDPIKHLKKVCEYVNQFPLTTSDTEIDILEDTKKTLAIADANKPTITQLKLAELLHAKKFETIINQIKNLDLNIKPISKIVASAYLGKSLTFITKDDNLFKNNFDKAITLEPNFYQAYAEVGSAFSNSFEKTEKVQYIEQSIMFFENAFRIKPNLKNLDILTNYCTAHALYSLHKQDIEQFKKTDQLFKNLLHIENSNANLKGNYGLFLCDYAEFTADINLYENAIYQLKSSTDLNPLDANHLSNYGLTLALYGVFKKDEYFLKQSLINLKKALEISPSKSDYKHNISTVLYNLYVITGNLSYLESAKTMSENALEKTTDNPRYLRTYGVILFEFEKIKNMKPISKLSYDYFSQAEILDPTNTFNLACYHAFNGDLDLCKKYILQTEYYSKLPKLQDFLSDKDLDNIRNEQWFIELLERLKAKEEAKEVT